MATTRTTLKRKAQPAKTPTRVELTTRGKAELTDSRKATDAELAANLHASAKAYNRDLAAASKAGLIIRAALEMPPVANSNDGADAAAQVMEAVVPPLVILDHIGRKYL